MSRYRGPRFKITRRLGLLPGLVQKTTHRTNLPGEHGDTPRKLSQYALRLQEKQKIRYNYGLTEGQLISYVKKARRLQGSTGENLLMLLEKRLDATLFRLGLAPTIRAARQYITHGHVTINTKKVTIPSYMCKEHEELRLTVDNQSPKGATVDSFNRSTLQLDIQELLIVELYSRK